MKHAIIVLGDPVPAHAWAEAWVDTRPDWAHMSITRLHNIVAQQTGLPAHSKITMAEAQRRWEIKLSTVIALSGDIICSDVPFAQRAALVGRLQAAGYAVDFEVLTVDTAVALA